ncbi:MAG TPA: hypothetical protein VES68_03695 [Candidatus Sulfotelmatobacter sp.]|nr:hypothetical protein [Candidatus Sulfotelmatobacter sp.]
MSEYSENNRPGTEQAYNRYERSLARRRKLSGVAKAIGALTLVGGLYVAASNSDFQQATQDEAYAQKQEQLIKEQLVKPDSFNDGTYRIIITDQLNVRKMPELQNNTVEWKDIIEIGGKNIQGAASFDVDKPYIKTGQNVSDPTLNGEWIELDAKVRDGSTIIDEELFIAKAPETSDFVQAIKSGITKPLARATQDDNLESVTVNITP